MLSFLPAAFKGALTLLLMLVNTVLWCTPLFLITFLRIVVPIKSLQVFIRRVSVMIAEGWIAGMQAILDLTQAVRWDLDALEGLQYRGWYMVTANHQSWVDILVLQRMCNRKLPFLKFFLKKELIWVPFLGVAWWALDFPFMKRFSKDYLAKNPHMKGKDLETTQKACEKFKDIPVSVMNFFEGTRFSESKKQRQESPYEYLLKPRAGGLAYALSAMDGKLTTLVDVSIVYKEERIGFWDFICGRVSAIKAEARTVAIPAELSQGDYENDPEFRRYVQQWVSDLWAEKDAHVSQLRQSWQS